MTERDLTLIRVWVEGNRKALEWKVGDRTFQIMGIKGSEGCYERFFNRGKHPERLGLSDEDALIALQGAITELEFYRGEKGSGEFFANAEAALVAAKRWLGQPV